MNTPSPTYQELEQRLRDAEDKIKKLQNTALSSQNSKSVEDKQDAFDNERYYKILADNSTDIVGILNLDLRFEYVSRSVETLSGYSQEECKALRLGDFLTPKSAKLALEAHYSCMAQGGCPQCLELEFQKKDGSVFITEVLSKPVFTNKGDFFGIHISFRDVSDRINLEKKIKAEQEWNKLVFSNLNDRILVFNKEAKLVFSSYIPVWFHPDHPQFIEDPVFNPIHPDDMPKVIKALHEGFQTRVGGRMDYRSKGDGKEYRWVEGNGNFVYFPGTNEPYLINVVRDIDDRKRLESELSNTIKTKDKLFSIIAHDLKSPFNALIGFSTELTENYDDYDEDTKKKFIDIIARTSKNTFKLLENMLAWARIQQGSIIINKEKFCLNDLINSCVALYENVAQLKNIQIFTHIPKPITVFADQAAISTILENLINNAIKFSNAESEIHIHVTENDSQIHLSIKDSGVGMTDELMRKLFKIDHDVTRNGTNNEKGTGLGLLLCKEFAEMNGGKIWVESKPGKGSTFTISIPEE